MRRIGHCGTLDPLATGVLVVCLGRYTRLSEWLSAGVKEYLATFFLGATSNTFDAQGEIAPKVGILPSRPEAVDQALKRFKGFIEQVPPAFSAVKVQGVRSYALARRHQAVPLKPRQVHITGIEVVDYDFPRLTLRIECSRGTYIRSLAADLGEELGCGAYVQALRRLRVGELDLQIALSLGAVEQAHQGGTLAENLVPVSRALSGLAKVVLQPEQLRRFVHGNPVALGASLGGGDGSQRCAVFDPDGTFFGIGEWEAESRKLKPKRVLRARDAAAEVAVHEP